jgi:hypothetical protein
MAGVSCTVLSGTEPVAYSGIRDVSASSHKVLVSTCCSLINISYLERLHIECFPAIHVCLCDTVIVVLVYLLQSHIHPSYPICVVRAPILDYWFVRSVHVLLVYFNIRNTPEVWHIPPGTLCIL